MKTTIYAVLRNGHTGTDIKKVELGKAILDEGRMSFRTYTSFRRKLSPAPKACYWQLESAEGLKADTSNEYAESYIRFKEVR